MNFDIDILELIRILILSIVQGITEWLPISSTGHMIIIEEFLSLTSSP
ncbi:MAG TPA: undecaprenyl-diphosphatase, partial [Globicatella sulfidifaciens]|nr:undecaprenyl-diphosphatase [Globicatella sulfidifaciens]